MKKLILIVGAGSAALAAMARRTAETVGEIRDLASGGPSIEVCPDCMRVYNPQPFGRCEHCQRDKAVEPEPAAHIELLACMLAASVATREPDLVIGPKDNPYLIRYWLRRDRSEGSIYLHWIHRNDDDRALHDHPWPSTSIVLQGTLREILPDSTRLLGPGSITSRSAEQAHRLEVVEGPVLTLFITGAVQREWGFHCPNGWKHWKDFTRPGNPGEIGQGCGESLAAAPACPECLGAGFFDRGQGRTRGCTSCNGSGRVEK